MPKRSKHYYAGQAARKAYIKSFFYGGMPRNLKGEDAAKLFLANVQEMMVQMATPLPKPRTDWIKGWDNQMEKEQ